MTNTNSPAVATKPAETGSAAAQAIEPSTQLQQMAEACLFRNGQLYFNDQPVKDLITELAARVSATELARIAVEASANGRTYYSLFLITRLIESFGRQLPLTERKLIQDTIVKCASRPCDAAALMALYWADGKRPVAAQLKKGLFRVLSEFKPAAVQTEALASPLQRARLRDILFITHAKPTTALQRDAFKYLADAKEVAQW